MTLPLRPFPMLTALMSFGLSLQFAMTQVSAQSAPPQVTTDTPEYCLQLLDKVSELVRVRSEPPQEILNLSSEGQRMCDQGQTRGGILRLRRALVLLQRNPGP